MWKNLGSILPMFMVAAGLLLVMACASEPMVTEPVETQESEVQITTETDPEETIMESETAETDPIMVESAPEEDAEPPFQDEAARQRFKAEAEAFMAEDIYYDYNSSSFDEAALEILERKAQWLLNNPDVSVIIEGHTDERRSNERNIMLGENRAGNVKGYLISRGVDSSRLITVSYGEERPVDPGHNEAAWRKNRRVHFVIKTAE